MKEALIDVAVLLIFFNRPEKTSEVFEQIKIARPTKLYLYQDGPRIGNLDDPKNIQACRDIVEKIDWDCDVNRLYQEDNFGCDPSEFIAQKWMFSTETKGIILEDDDVPSQSFFPFCKDLLDRYEQDYRINMICGMNNLGTIERDSSYIFSEYGSIWGWATWKRNVDKWDSEYRWLQDSKIVGDIQEYYRIFDGMLEICKKHKATGREHYESILGAHQHLYHQLNIVPTKNMITNIGIGSETTHSTNDVKRLPRAIRKLLYKKRYEIDFPLKHPTYMIEDMEFKREFNKISFPSQWRKIGRKIEVVLYRIFPFLR